MNPNRVQPELTSIELHLRFPACAVVTAERLRDTACGLYPCYYRRLSNRRLQVSTSAVALIAAAGTLELNVAFQPRDFLAGGGGHDVFVRASGGVPKAIKQAVKARLPAPWLRRLSRNRFWYESWDTIDRRVSKLRPFEEVGPEGRTVAFHPDFSLTDPHELVTRVARCLRAFMNRIERQYPRHEHVIMTGGKDSLLLALVPKLSPRRWHIFSSDPNGPLVREWLRTHGIGTGQFFGHDNVNEERPADTRRKIVCGDLYSDPRHSRWLPTLRAIARRFESRCIFWSGSAGDALHVGCGHYRRYRDAARIGFFDIHRTRVPSLVGNYHQIVKNMTGCPLLCPYHHEEIWRDVYLHHGPAVIPAGLDLRPRIGERLVGHPVRWPRTNPSPSPYRYLRPMRMREVYLQHLDQVCRRAPGPAANEQANP